MNGLIIFLILLTCGFVFGRAAERAHYYSLNKRERWFSNLPVISSRQPDISFDNEKDCRLVCGCCVISIDYFKRLLAFFRLIFGGPLTSYETLLERARREAILRMMESCPEAEIIVNLRIEIVLVVVRRRNRTDCFARGCISVLAQHRNKIQFRIGVLAVPVAFDSNPLHLPAVAEFVLTNDRNIVFGLACSDAGAAARTSIEIDRHRPRVVKLFVVAGFSISLPAMYQSVDEIHVGSTRIGMLLSFALCPALPPSSAVD